MNGRYRTADVGLAAAVLALTVAMLEGGGFGDPTSGSRALDVLGLVLAAAASLPLAARRRAPLAAYAVICAASVALFALRYPLDVPFGAVAAVYSVAYTYGGDSRPTHRAAAMASAGGFVPATAAAYATAGRSPTTLLPELLFWAVVFVGVWLAGDRARLRREQLTELEQRARRTEREAERERRLAAAEERTRIARELHDSAGHAINVILVQAGAARLLQRRDPERSQRAIATIEQVARETIGEIDRLVRALRDDKVATPPVATDPGALAELVARHRATGLAVDGELGLPPRPLPPSVSWAAYRILQEALTNAARHGCGDAQVAVEYRAEAVEITVANPTTAHNTTLGGGHGIVGMRERAVLLGGRLEATMDRGEFRLYAWLPYGERTEPDPGATGDEPARAAVDEASA
ncbi:MAG TPA: histidine kinase [Micromonosporaceae bacterium]